MDPNYSFTKIDKLIAGRRHDAERLALQSRLCKDSGGKCRSPALMCLARWIIRAGQKLHSFAAKGQNFNPQEANNRFIKV